MSNNINAVSALTTTTTTTTTTTSQPHLGPLASEVNPTPTPPRDPPPPPIPSSDPKLNVVEPIEDNGRSDLFKLKPIEALQLLSASVEMLVKITGDVPPTPPPKTPTYPQMSGMQVEKENIARSHSEKNLARMRALAIKDEEKNGSDNTTPSAGNQLLEASLAASANTSTFASESIDGVHLKHETHIKDAFEITPDVYLIVRCGDSQPVNVQHGAITRRFYSKNEPPISVGEYLMRLYRFCPMSTAVYLATSLYIHRLAVEERTIPVTRRNAHRLVLAGLRVAMKALEDLSYPHARVARVGGVSELELARLEVNFCFLANFELVVREEGLRRHLETLRSMRVDDDDVPALRIEKEDKKTAL